MTLPRSTCSAEGVDATGIRDLVDAARAADLDLHSLMVARHGRVVAEGWWAPYTAQRPALVYSLSKTLTATAVALLQQQGLLHVDDLLLDHLPGVDRDAIDPIWSRVRLSHCLSMTVGFETDVEGRVFDRSRPQDFRADDEWLHRVLATPPTREPGTLFTYNQAATYLLSVVVTAVAGGGVEQVLLEGIPEVLEVGEIPWHRDPLGREMGFSGAHVPTGTVLSLAQLYLDRGRRDGVQLVDEAWFDRAAVAFGPLNADPDAGEDWRRGYGFSLWVQRHGYRGDGAFGQFLLVLPEHDVVVAVTSEHERMQSLLDLVWEHLVPAVDRAGSPEADAELAGRLADARIEPRRAAAPAGPDVARLRRADDEPSSALSRAYRASTVRRGPDGASTLELDRDGLTLPVRVGSGEWLESQLEADGWRLPIVASGGWTDDTHYVAEVIAIETPHRFTVEGRLDDAPDDSTLDSTTDASGEVRMTWRLGSLMGPDPFGLAVRTTD
ncbi:CubicO group peptidase (beta-lactamase class C family) [Terracoccus luteus]|uniref:CubicO group peptidase (Beta-lactamase class C family) n=1 Tax=Terracoccus luteus TaxID=53356 RepID=A0A495Y3D4_9MICO|nr:serine hydrolase domain-containing protein [Terracoccus luteus]RKT78718.1 CubicO group peptidase (beta-lactamase class C family) [Terracoccus luteus]